MPMTTNPMWATEVYATSFLASGCTAATQAAYTMPAVPSTSITVTTEGCWEAAGKNGSRKRRNP